MTIRGQAALGRAYFYAIVGVQLALTVIVAPAATAGAVCVERSRVEVLGEAEPPAVDVRAGLLERTGRAQPVRPRRSSRLPADLVEL